jgi:alpha-tubulin suppressor-like RCC1 family protein
MITPRSALHLTFAAALGLSGPALAMASGDVVQLGVVRFDARHPALDVADIRLGGTTAGMLTIGHDGHVSLLGSWSGKDAALPDAAGPCRALARSKEAMAVIRLDGSIGTQGLVKDASGQQVPLSPPPGTFVPGTLQAGTNHFLAVRTDGVVVAFGATDLGQCEVPASLVNPRQLLARGNTSIAIDADGTLHQWGAPLDASVTLPAGLGGCQHLAFGTSHGLAVRLDGTVVAWGSNTDGQASVPADLGPCVQVAGGAFFSAAMGTDGSVRTWGQGTHFGLPRTAFPAGGALGPCSRIVAGAQALAGLGLDGHWKVIGFGDVSNAERLDDWGSLRSVASAHYFTVGVRDDGSVQAWGSTWPSLDSRDFRPVEVPSDLGTCVAAAGGFYHALLLQADGTVRGIGSNRLGENSVPADLGGVVQVAAGVDASLARIHDGTVRGWGEGWYDDESISRVPTDLPPSRWIAAYFTHAGSVATNGSVRVWGRSQLPSPPAGLPELTQLALGQAHALGLKSDGFLVTWGNGLVNSWGSHTVPPDIGACTQIAAGGAHNVVLQADGQVKAWGNYYAGTSIAINHGRATVSAGVGACRFVAAGPETVVMLTQSTCPSDLDGSGEVDAADLGTLLTRFGACGACAADLDGSGEVDAGDIGALLVMFGACP